MNKTNEQELIDMLFDISFMIHEHPYFKNKSRDEIAKWIRDELAKRRYKVIPSGQSWGMLVEIN